MPRIKFEEETIGDILHSRLQLRVPINQRSYAWKEEHVEELYRDLNGAISKAATEYFLGSIIVVHSGDTIEVHDGQQRLATTMILIAAIRDYFYRNQDHPTAETISAFSLRSRDRATLDIHPHFSLSAEDNAFFVNKVLLLPDDPLRKSAKTDPKKESHQRIAGAAKFAAEFVATLTQQLPADQRAPTLHKWLNFIDKGARVIWVEVADEATAYQVFETMNDRGLKLSSADLIKNYLFSLGDNRKEEIVQRWQSMTATLEALGPKEGDVVDFIRCVWVMEHGPTRSNLIFQGIKDEVGNKTAAVTWTTMLAERAVEYTAMLNSSHVIWTGYHQETRSAVETLRFFGVSQIRPLLLAALLKFSKKEREKLFKVAIGWSIRCLIAGVPSGTLEGYYARNAKKIFDGATTSVASLTSDMVAIIPDDDRFHAAMVQASVSDAALARYYLRVLQMQADNKPEPEYVPNAGIAVTLEHILPQNPGPGWKHITPDEAKANYNRLGNQALLPGSVNSKIGNSEYSDKKAALQASGFSLTSEAAANTIWSIAEITARQQRLATLAVKAWPL